MFGTKNRNNWIEEKFESQLHGYMAATLMSLDCQVIIINSMPDQIHILFRMSKKYTIAHVVGDLKRLSSRWIKGVVGGIENFQWQNGYGAFSVSYSKLEIVRRYIENQKEHHKNTTFQNEMDYFSEGYGINLNRCLE